MSDLYFNGEPVNEDEFYQLLDESREYMIEQEDAIQKSYQVSSETASAILYLRSRSRWTVEKEMELVYRDRDGNPISLGAVLSGEF